MLTAKAAQNNFRAGGMRISIGKSVPIQPRAEGAAGTERAGD